MFFDFGSSVHVPGLDVGLSQHQSVLSALSLLLHSRDSEAKSETESAGDTTNRLSESEGESESESESIIH